MAIVLPQFFIGSIAEESSAKQFQKLSKLLMNNTYLVSGEGRSHDQVGTGFIVAWKIPGKFSKEGAAHKLVLITAAHVLEGIADDKANLVYRISNKSEQWKPIIFALTIRKSKKPLWSTVPGTDVAVIDFADNLDQEALAKVKSEWTLHGVIADDLFVTDEFIEQYDVQPGEELFCLGFPYATPSNELFFPVLRGGHLASYPIIPSRSISNWLFDFEVNEGDSGGPVFIMKQHPMERKGNVKLGMEQRIMGVLTSEASGLGAKESIHVGNLVPITLLRDFLDTFPPGNLANVVYIHFEDPIK